MYCIVPALNTIFVISNTEHHNTYNMKTENKIAMNTKTILNRIFMMLTLVTFFIGNQSFVQDDTTIEKGIAPSVKDTTVCCEQIMLSTPVKGKTAETKISFRQNLQAIDAEVYGNFLKEFGSIDFSFLRKSGAAAEVEIIRNFNEAAAPKVAFNFANANIADAESVENFMKSQPKLIGFNWNDATAQQADADIVTRFKNEFTPKIILASLQADHLRASDAELMQQFYVEFGNKKEGFAQK